MCSVRDGTPQASEWDSHQHIPDARTERKPSSITCDRQLAAQLLTGLWVFPESTGVAPLVDLTRTTLSARRSKWALISTNVMTESLPCA